MKGETSKESESHQKFDRLSKEIRFSFRTQRNKGGDRFCCTHTEKV